MIGSFPIRIRCPRVAYPDQWDYLTNIQRMSKVAIEEIIALYAEKTDELVNNFSEEINKIPWKNIHPKTPAPKESIPKAPIIDTQLPNTLPIVIANGIYIEKNKTPTALLNQLIHLAAFRNPEFYKAQAMRMPVYNKPRMIACYDDSG